MKSNDVNVIETLLTPEAVRQRCSQVFEAAEANGSKYFHIHDENFDAAVDLVEREIIANYPNGKVPFHSRWRHFEFDNQNFWKKAALKLTKKSKNEIARSQIDLAVISVLLDAGAGTSWRYKDLQTGLKFSRSEGLAIASLRLFESGVLSQSGLDDPLRVDAASLQALTPEILAKEFQVSQSNQLLGLKDRAKLLNRLGDTLLKQKNIFEAENTFRPGNLFDYLTRNQVTGVLEARDILVAVLQGMGEIWPDGSWIDNVAIGDAGYHEVVKRSDITDGIVPFHKLSQWMSYSLIEPLQEAGFKVNNLDTLTGLAEYRNGGLFIDTKAISLKDRTQLEIVHDPKSPLVVEWRALTVVLLDKLAEKIRRSTNTDSGSMPLARILQGGTWSAGRRIAQQLRANGVPPLQLNSRGTIF